MEPLTFDVDAEALPGNLELPEGARGLVVFAHGSGSSRLSPRNRQVAETLRQQGGLGTLLFDLLTPAEDADYANRFDITLLARRLTLVTRRLLDAPDLSGLPIGFFGASTGAAAAIVAAAGMAGTVRAVVSRGGRPDLAGGALERLRAPTLLIVGGHDQEVLELNRRALDELGAEDKALEVVPGATHLFEEPGALEQVTAISLQWFQRFLG
jgi:pimeloyl-ACP methyl ester carboxylesterase